MIRHVSPCLGCWLKQVRSGGLVFVSTLCLVASIPVDACIWDAVTLKEESQRRREMSALILNPVAGPGNPASHLERINQLRAHPKEGDVSWWNDLAGGYIRAGNPGEAAKILEPLLQRFPNDYGIHANLGTAYHLLGRFKDAEREILRDLEINPDAHFGLERYHLALLQYLSRDKEYQKRHVYLDEYTRYFLAGFVGRVWADDGLEQQSQVDRRGVIGTVKGAAGKSGAGQQQDESWNPDAGSSDRVAPPSYRFRWNLARDPGLRDGVSYMAVLNPREPACHVMLGIVCLEGRDFHLAIKAFERAIEMGSEQTALLRGLIQQTEKYIAESAAHSQPTQFQKALYLCCAILIALLVINSLKARRKAPAANS